MNTWHFGTIGYSYKDWVGGFYPPGTSQRDYLAFYCKIFNTVELDTTFHSPPRHEVIEGWRAAVPPGFKFSVKTPHLITHEMKLTGGDKLMEDFLDTLRPLGDALGPVLIQLPPGFRRDRFSILDEFLASLPGTYRYSVELRHSSWFNDQTAQMLSQYNVCWATIDFPNIPKVIIPTTDFLFFRWVGNNGMYQHHSYERVEKNNELLWWINEIRRIEPAIPDIYGYFNNDYTGFAAGTCKRFMIMAGLLDETDDLPYQERLF